MDRLMDRYRCVPTKDKSTNVCLVNSSEADCKSDFWLPGVPFWEDSSGASHCTESRTKPVPSWCVSSSSAHLKPRLRSSLLEHWAYLVPDLLQSPWYCYAFYPASLTSVSSPLIIQISNEMSLLWEALPDQYTWGGFLLGTPFLGFLFVICVAPSQGGSLTALYSAPWSRSSEQSMLHTDLLHAAHITVHAANQLFPRSVAAVTSQDFRNQATAYINSSPIAVPSGDGYKI